MLINVSPSSQLRMAYMQIIPTLFLLNMVNMQITLFSKPSSFLLGMVDVMSDALDGVSHVANTVLLEAAIVGTQFVYT